jgi:hypothetical protein
MKVKTEMNIIDPYACWQSASRARRSSHWPCTQGTLTSTIQEFVGEESGRSFSATLSYRYTVQGITYESHRVVFDNDSLSGGVEIDQDTSKLEQLLSRYPDGRITDVRYDPRNHGLSVLKPGIHGKAVYHLVVGFIWSVMAIAWVVGLGLIAFVAA